MRGQLGYMMSDFAYFTDKLISIINRASQSVPKKTETCNDPVIQMDDNIVFQAKNEIAHLAGVFVYRIYSKQFRLECDIRTTGL